MGRSGKLPSGVSAKLKRWKKGHSSDSNPAICRYRQAARSRFFSRPSGRSDLTVDAVKLHNELQSGSLRLGKSEAPETPMEEEAELAVTEKSSGTFLSGLSDCTNVTFSKVQRFWESNSAAHKEICAVLAAVTEVIRSQGGKETETEYFAALVLSCLATLLRKQDLEAWGYPVTLQVYHGLLSFTVHPKPKIRKAAQHGVCSVLKGSEFMFGEKAPAHHPAAISTAKFCIQEIEKSGGSKEATTMLHMLTLLKDLLPCFPEGLVKSCSETLLRVMTLSHVLVTACAMQAFHSLFHARPGLSTLSAELNAQIITALYDYVPSENDLQPLLAWLKVMEKAHINLVSYRGLERLSRFSYTSPLGFLEFPHLKVVEEGLTYKFHAAWSSVLQLLCVFFEACGRQAHPVMRKVSGEWLGPGQEVVLALGLETLDFPRSWLLPVIRDHVQETRLGFFTTYFLPLANTLKSKAMDLAQAGSTVESKIYDTLQWQIWTLLPGFCTRPTDVAISFKGLARTLGTAISERPDLRVTVCQALRTLITKGCQAGTCGLLCWKTIRTYLTITDTQLVNSLLEKASEKVLDPASSDFTSRLSVLDLVVALAPCADEAAISKLYSTIRPYLESKAHGVQKKAYRVLEEVCASPQGPGALFVQSHLEDLKKTLLDSLRSTSSPAKRPRLKCLLHIVRKLSAEHEEFISALVPEVILCTKEVSVGARKNAFALLVEMGHAFLRFGSNEEGKAQGGLGLGGVPGVLDSDALTATGLMGTSTVEQLLENVCLLLASRTRDVVKSALGFIKVAVTVMDVAHLAKHVQLVMEAIGKLSDDMRRHFRMKLRNLFTKFIRKFGFELVKRLLPEEYHKVLVNIRKAEARAKRHRALSQAATEEEEEEEEEEEPAQGKGDSIEEILADSEDEEDNEEERSRGKEQRKLARQRSRAWLKEGGGDEPLNFLDPKVAQRVLATQPGPGRGRKKDHGFKVSADGRLIIREEADGNKMEEEEGAKGEDEDMADLMEDVIIRKRVPVAFLEEAALALPDSWSSGGSGIHRPVAKKAMPGAEYKAKKAKGDVKKKGRPDPYAYIPLNRSKLNRRKKMKLQGQFKGLVKAARRGSQVGHKNRRKDHRP
uniref:Ribosomal RNA processing 12 homolog n=1 Tax=Nomascus leucogenys TaxID=61853 RepID=A0A2I3HVC1_NOMLE